MEIPDKHHGTQNISLNVKVDEEVAQVVSANHRHQDHIFYA